MCVYFLRAKDSTSGGGIEAGEDSPWWNEMVKIVIYNIQGGTSRNIILLQQAELDQDQDPHSGGVAYDSLIGAPE